MSFFVLLLAIAAPAAAQTFPALTGRVVDQANIIPDDREAAMAQQLEQLQRATSRQLVVATVTSLEDYPIEDYANRLFRAWRLGQNEADNGALLLVAPNERKVRIETGYGLEGIMTDAVTSQIIRQQIIPRFRENDYPGGIEAGVGALVTQLAAPPEQAEQRALEAERARQQEGQGGGGEGWFILIGFLVIFGIPVLLGVIEAASSGRRRPARPSPWGRAYREQRRDDSGLGWFIAGAVLDGVLRGGGSGGSSWGGGSFGGGGGGFSGGGGSSGGGGASGSW